MTEADQYEGEATSTATGGACDTDGNPRVRVFQRTASHARSSASRGDAASSKHCRGTEPRGRSKKFADPTRKAREFHDRRVNGGGGESPLARIVAKSTRNCGANLFKQSGARRTPMPGEQTAGTWLDEGHQRDTTQGCRIGGTKHFGPPDKQRLCSDGSSRRGTSCARSAWETPRL